MSLFCGAIGQNRDDLQVQTEPSLNFVLYFFDKKKGWRPECGIRSLANGIVVAFYSVNAKRRRGREDTGPCFVKKKAAGLDQVPGDSRKPKSSCIVRS